MISNQTPQSEIEDYINGKIAQTRDAIIYNFQYVGESCIAQARTWQNQVNPYTDRTGNLRSSVGYIIVENGKIVGKSSFNVVKQGGIGKSEGVNFAQSLVSQFPTSIVLICVAGMKYATYVADKGYDVIDSAEDLAAKLVPEMLKQLGFK